MTLHAVLIAIAVCLCEAFGSRQVQQATCSQMLLQRSRGTVLWSGSTAVQPMRDEVS